MQANNDQRGLLISSKQQLYREAKAGKSHVKLNTGGWHFDERNESSILGAHFAQAVAAISTGKIDLILSANKVKARKKLFFEEPHLNPLLTTSHISHQCDAHFMEESLHWRKNGITFPTAKRDFKVPAPKVFVKTGSDPDHGTAVFGRKRQIRPLSRRKKLQTEIMKHDIVS
jgi:hypothetical protein